MRDRSKQGAMWLRSLAAVPLLAASIVLFSISPVLANDSYISTRADYAVIMDYETGTVLYGKDANTPMPPASMSKLMTLAVVFDLLKQGRLTLDTEFYVSEKAWRTGGSKMFVLVNTKISVRDLIKGIIVDSGNDACIVIAENISSPVMGLVSQESELGSEAAFAEIMNRKAREWGLLNSSFANPTGLPDPAQRMSPLDLARLARHILTEYEAWYPFFSLEEFTWSDITQSNRNPLLAGFDGADGLKTGHTEEAGYGLVGSATVDGARRIIVLNGLESISDRAREANRVMGLAFSEFRNQTFFRGGDIIGEAGVFMGKDATVPLMIRNDVSFILHKDELAAAKASFRYDGPLRAPVDADQQVGLLRIEIPGREAYDYPLYTTKRVRQIGMFGKISLGLQRMLTPPTAEDIQ